MFVVFIGAPGSGKGTQSERLLSLLNAPHVSTGDMLRAARGQDSLLGRAVSEYMDQGRLVPDHLVIEMVEERLAQPDCRNGCLFDGYPRNLAQAERLLEFLEARQTPLDLVLELQVKDDELVQRLVQRKRADDSLQTIKRRLEVYQAETTPLLQYYGQQDLLESIDGSGTPDEVFARIKATVERRRAAANQDRHCGS